MLQAGWRTSTGPLRRGTEANRQPYVIKCLFCEDNHPSRSCQMYDAVMEAARALPRPTAAVTVVAQTVGQDLATLSLGSNSKEAAAAGTQQQPAPSRELPGLSSTGITIRDPASYTRAHTLPTPPQGQCKGSAGTSLREPRSWDDRIDTTSEPPDSAGDRNGIVRAPDYGGYDGWGGGRPVSKVHWYKPAQPSRYKPAQPSHLQPITATSFGGTTRPVAQVRQGQGAELSAAHSELGTTADHIQMVMRESEAPTPKAHLPAPAASHIQQQRPATQPSHLQAPSLTPRKQQADFSKDIPPAGTLGSTGQGLTTATSFGGTTQAVAQARQGQGAALPAAHSGLGTTARNSLAVSKPSPGAESPGLFAQQPSIPSAARPLVLPLEHSEFIYKGQDQQGITLAVHPSSLPPELQTPARIGQPPQSDSLKSDCQQQQHARSTSLASAGYGKHPSPSTTASNNSALTTTTSFGGTAQSFAHARQGQGAAQHAAHSGLGTAAVNSLASAPAAPAAATALGSPGAGHIISPPAPAPAWRNQGASPSSTSSKAVPGFQDIRQRGRIRRSWGQSPLTRTFFRHYQGPRWGTLHPRASHSISLSHSSTCQRSHYSA